jgi:hypothetical protein
MNPSQLIPSLLPQDVVPVELVDIVEEPNGPSKEDMSVCMMIMYGFVAFIIGIFMLVFAACHFALDFAAYAIVCCGGLCDPENEVITFENDAAEEAYYNSTSSGSCSCDTSMDSPDGPVAECLYCTRTCIACALQVAAVVVAGGAILFHEIVNEMAGWFGPHCSFRSDYEAVDCCDPEFTLRRSHVSLR